MWDFLNVEVPNFNFKIFTNLETRIIGPRKSVVATIMRFSDMRTYFPPGRKTPIAGALVGRMW